jgi:hypothetical protein
MLMTICIAGLANMVFITFLMKIFQIELFFMKMIGFILYLSFSLFYIYISAVIIAITGSVAEAN